MQLHFPTAFTLSEQVETARGETCRRLADALRSCDVPASASGDGDDVADVLEICRHGLEMSKDALLGKAGAQWASQVEASLRQRTLAEFRVDKTVKIAYEGNTFQVWCCGMSVGFPECASVSCTCISRWRGASLAWYVIVALCNTGDSRWRAVHLLPSQGLPRVLREAAGPRGLCGFAPASVRERVRR